jgi:hypothetical protein
VPNICCVFDSLFLLLHNLNWTVTSDLKIIHTLSTRPGFYYSPLLFSDDARNGRVFIFRKKNFPYWGFSVLFPQLYGNRQGITRVAGARPALFPIRRYFLRGSCIVNFSLTTLVSNPRKHSNQSCYLCCSVYCLCVNVYCTTAIGCQPNCS